MNLSLPTLAVWKARSFWAQLLLVATVLFNAIGIDLMGLFQAMGLGDNPEQVIDGGISLWQTVAPIIFGFWAWWERRSPNFRLVWPWQSAAVMLLCLFLMTGTPAGAAAVQDVSVADGIYLDVIDPFLAIILPVLIGVAFVAITWRTGPKDR